MRFVFTIFLFFATSLVLGQDRYYRYQKSQQHMDVYEEHVSKYASKYPYAKGYTPRFLGLIVGYNFLTKQEFELGLAYNLVDSPTDFGLTGGYQLVYRRSLERNLNAVDLELGIYGLVSLGFGVNYNFSNEASAVGFKPFIGTSIYHFQLIYGYNFLRRQKVDWYGLPQHSVRIRYVIPIIANKNSYIEPAPAPYYRYLRGLHKDHPLERNTEGERFRGDIQLR